MIDDRCIQYENMAHEWAGRSKMRKIIFMVYSGAEATRIANHLRQCGYKVRLRTDYGPYREMEVERAG